jgi:hypothetical protein
MMRVLIGRLALGIVVGLAVGHGAKADDQAAPIQVTIKDHRFSPAEIHIASGKAIFLEITNLDAEPEEFEMRQLAIEKVIPAGGTGRVRLRPLGPGALRIRRRISRGHGARRCHGGVGCDVARGARRGFADTGSAS